ncbi:hypothetical protein I7I50_06338 [Histoplasma capsulatum G186AR]|uniref:Uncharacterized protein n=1 Tax=Ajellomyces capsulatus TaxID=5037 RepID=A0A8H8D413_AJECA|nr:hypothetical protein I7I52_10589 [Histoplasma capsulatum]QSS67309.1 hypothetical protein I7I50_06338 [Histoplasma capsulatum G186AR]
MIYYAGGYIFFFFPFSYFCFLISFSLFPLHSVLAGGSLPSLFKYYKLLLLTRYMTILCIYFFHFYS